MRIRVLIVDDHPVVREGIATIVNRSSICEVVAEASNGQQAIDLFLQHKPDVTVMDLKMPQMDGVQTIGKILELDPNAKIVVLSAYDQEETVYQALKAGAMSYVLKDSHRDELIEAIQAVHEGKKRINYEIATKLVERINKPSLTEREIGILKLIAVGKSNREIGVEMNISEGTVKVHVNNIFTKLNVRDRTEAANIAITRGII